MNNFICLVAIVSFAVLGSCQNKQEKNNPRNGEKRNQPLTGKVFIIGPNLDSVNTRSFGECDCCMSQIAFLNDSIFIALDECMFNNGYYKGRYSTAGDTVELIADPLYISAEVDERLSENDNNKVKLKIFKVIKSKYYWTEFTLNKIKCFKTNMDSFSFATPDTINLKAFYEAIKSESDSIPKILGIDF